MKRHNRLKKHTLGLAAALLMTAGMSQIAPAGDSVYVNTSSLRYRTSAQIKDNNIAGNLPTVRSWSAWEPADSGR